MKYNYIDKNKLGVRFNTIPNSEEVKKTLANITRTIGVVGKEDEYNLHRATLCKLVLTSYCKQEVQFDLDGLKAATEFIHYTSAIHHFFEVQETLYSIGSFYGHILKLHFNGEWSGSKEGGLFPLNHRLRIPDLMSIEPIGSVEVSYNWGKESTLTNQFFALNNLFKAQVGIDPISENKIC